MNLKQLFSLIFISILALTSCQDESSGERILPPNTGRHAEIVVVADSAIWASQTAQSLKEIYQKHYPLLIKTEPFFDLIVFNESEFSSILRTHKNIIIITDSDSINEIKTFQDRWAKDQQVLYMRLKDDIKLNKQVRKSKTSLFNYFYKADLTRIAKKSTNNKLNSIYHALQKEKGIELSIPQDFYIVEDTTDFIWVRREKPHLTESITFYEEDYIDENQFSLNHILNKRDSLYKNHIEGSVEGSYMSTERRPEYAPIIDTIDVNNEFSIRTRGWWKMENDFMGGYFVRYSIPDLDRRKIIHLEAFLYCPKYNKMFYLRELEAIISSFNFTKNIKEN